MTTTTTTTRERLAIVRLTAEYEDAHLCVHDGCDLLVPDMDAHMQDHRDSHVGEDEECCTGCGYHAAVWCVVRGNSTSGAYIVERAGCECDHGDLDRSLADILSTHYSVEEAQAAADEANDDDDEEVQS